MLNFVDRQLTLLLRYPTTATGALIHLQLSECRGALLLWSLHPLHLIVEFFVKKKEISCNEMDFQS